MLRWDGKRATAVTIVPAGPGQGTNGPQAAAAIEAAAVEDRETGATGLLKSDEKAETIAGTSAAARREWATLRVSARNDPGEASCVRMRCADDSAHLITSDEIVVRHQDRQTACSAILDGRECTKTNGPAVGRKQQEDAA